MPNPIQNFLSAFRTPDQPVAKAAKPMAIGATSIPVTSLRNTLGQPHDLDYSILYGLYRYNTDVSGCVHLLAGRTVSPGWRMALLDEDVKPTDAQLADMKELSRWLKRPNPTKTMTQLLLGVIQHLVINGDAYWYVSRDKKGVPLEIWPMHPTLTRVVATQEGEVLGYVMRSMGGDPVTFKPEEVIHFQLPSPNSDIYGEGRVELVVEEAGIDLQALRANKSIFINGLSPSALLILDDKATPEDARMLTEMIRQGHTGADNRNKILALSRVQDFKPYSMTLKDMEFLGLRNLSTEKVTTGMGVPKFLLGNHNAGDYASSKFLVRNMDQTIIMVIQDIVGELITEQLIHSINPDYAWLINAPDSSDPDVVRKDQLSAKQAGILTTDEVRQDSFDKEPLEEQDSIPDDNDSGDEKQPDEVDTNDDDTQTPDEVEDEKQKRVERSQQVTKADEPADIATTREAELDTLADTLAPAVAQFFTGQEAGYLDRLSDELTAAKLNGYVNAGNELEDTALHMLLFGLLVSSLTAGSAAAQLQIEISLGFDQTNPMVQDYLRVNALQHAKGINTTTREAIKVQLQEGLKAGEGVNQLVDRIRTVFTDAKGYRAQLIARNETAQAYQYANHAALKLAGAEYRRWITAGENRVCPICAPLDGYTIRFDAQYPDGLEPSHAHVSCRCTEVAATKEDYDQFNQRNG